MARIAFKMMINEGAEAEYKRRHDQLWPELKELLKKTGIRDYSIFHDPETNCLFAYLVIDEASGLDSLPTVIIMKKWWSHMKDIMKTNEDDSPVSISLKEVFYLP
jgi:L-rhamnose mutarotase